MKIKSKRKVNLSLAFPSLISVQLLIDHDQLFYNTREESLWGSTCAQQCFDQNTNASMTILYVHSDSANMLFATTFTILV